MTDDMDKLSALELDLKEHDTLERAGVFAKTRVETGLLISQPIEFTPAVLRLRKQLALTAAAVVVLAVGVWSAMFSMELSDVRIERDRMAQQSLPESEIQPFAQPIAQPVPLRQAPSFQLADSTTTSFQAFHDCLNGPADAQSGHCADQDYDRDGDIDLADFRTLQISITQ